MNKTDNQNRKTRSLIRLILIVLAVVIIHGLVLWLLTFRQSPGKVRSTGNPGKVTTTGGEREQVKLNQTVDSADRLKESGRNLDAAKLYDEVLSRRPADLRALFGKAQALMNLERWEEAMPVLNRLLGLDPENVDALLNRSRVYLERGDLDSYVEQRRLAQKAAPEMVRTNLELGRALAWVKKDRESLKYLNQAMKLGPTRPEKAAILTSTAYVYKLRREPDQAEKLLEESLSLGVTGRDNEIQCYFMLIGIYLDQNRDSKAIKMMEKYRRMDPDFHLARYMGREIIATHYRNMGSLSLYRNRLEDAEKYYTRSLELEPDNRQGLIERAFVRMLSGRREGAASDVKKWQKTLPPAPDNAGEMERFAIANTVLGNKIKAFSYMDRAVEAEPGNYRYLGTRAFINHTFGNSKQFQRDLDLFLARCDKNERQGVRMLLKRLGRP